MGLPITLHGMALPRVRPNEAAGLGRFTLLRGEGSCRLGPRLVNRSSNLL